MIKLISAVLFASALSFAVKASEAYAYTIDTYGTFHAGGVRVWPVPVEVTSASLQFRKQGETAWRNGLDPVIALANARLETGMTSELDVVQSDLSPMISRVHGSILNLDPGTTYDVRINLKRADGSVYDTVTTTLTTRVDQVVYGTGRQLRVSAGGTYPTIASAMNVALPGDIITVDPGIYRESIRFTRSGQPGQPITLRGSTGAVIDDLNNTRLIDFAGGVHDVILEGFEIRTAQPSTNHRQIKLRSGNTRIVIQNNVFNIQGDQTDYVLLAAWEPNQNEVLIQNNKVNATGYVDYTIHYGEGRGVVIRNNELRLARCYDAITIRGHHEDTDVYNNYIEGSPMDDGLELEGGANINVRFWGNTIKVPGGDRGTVSNIPVTVGPVYFVRNTFYAAQQYIKYANDGVINAISSGAVLADFAPVFYYHNTFYQDSARWAQPFFRFSTLCHGRGIFVNNIFYGKTYPSDAIQNAFPPTSRTTAQWGQISSDYNLFYDGKTTANPYASYGIDLHSRYGDPRFVNMTASDVHLLAGSPAIDGAVRVPDVNDTFSGAAPDLGAFEFSSTDKVAPAAPKNLRTQ